MAAITEQEIQKAIDMFNNGMSVTKIAKALNRDRGTLTKRMKAAGVNITQHCNKKQVNSSFFDEWNELSAYWLGFIFADGHLTNNNQLDICIKDKDHLEKFKANINSEHSISTKIINGKSYYRINITDKQIGTRLKQLGVNSNKTYGWTIPEIPHEYIKHFIRGLYDGDGNFNDRKYRPVIRIVSYDVSVLENLMDIIKKEVPSINGHIRIYNYENRVPELNMSTQNGVQDVLEWLYSDSTIYLDRKYQKYLGYAVLRTNRKDS